MHDLHYFIFCRVEDLSIIYAFEMSNVTLILISYTVMHVGALALDVLDHRRWHILDQMFRRIVCPCASVEQGFSFGLAFGNWVHILLV